MLIGIEMEKVIRFEELKKKKLIEEDFKKMKVFLTQFLTIHRTALSVMEIDPKDEDVIMTAKMSRDFFRTEEARLECRKRLKKIRVHLKYYNPKEYPTIKEGYASGYAIKKGKEGDEES
jgi:hypothetical protein